MRSDLKIGMIVGILVVAGIIIYLVGNSGKSEKSLPPVITPDKTPASSSVAPPAISTQAESPKDRSAQPPSEKLVVVPPPGKVTEVKIPPDIAQEKPRPENISPQEQGEPVIRPPRFHTVKEDDNLSVISEKYYGHSRFWQVIYDANRQLIKNPDRLQVGWQLRIPYPDEVTQKP